MRQVVLHYLKAFCVAMVFIGVFWLGESAVHAYILDLGSFSSQLFPHDANEVSMRCMIAVLFMVIVFLAAHYVRQKMFMSRRVQLAYQALKVMREGCVITDCENKIIYVNKRYEEISGYNLKDVVGKNPSVLSSGKQDKAFYKVLWEKLLSDGYWEGEVWNRTRSGELYPQWTNISTITDSRGKIRYHVGVFSDITSQKSAEEKIKRYAYYDPLTDLPNRRFFMEKLVQHIKLAKREKQTLAVLFIDLDRFKPINDEHGHLVGDQFLREFSKLVQSSVREVDTVSRFGGDEFVILLPNVNSKDQAGRVAEKLLAICSNQTIAIDGHDFTISLSMGAAIYPDDASDSESLITKADEAMYEVKKGARHGDQFNDDDKP